VIGRPCKDVPAAGCESILGYSIANECRHAISKRLTVSGQEPKGMTPSARLAWIVTDLSPLDPGDLELRTEVNGQVKQHSRTSLMIHDVGAIVEWISAVMTLLPAISSSPDAAVWGRLRMATPSPSPSRASAPHQSRSPQAGVVTRPPLGAGVVASSMTARPGLRIARRVFVVCTSADNGW